MLVFINLSWAGDWDNGIAITDRAVHHKRWGVVNHIPFAELPGKKISLEGSKVLVGTSYVLSIRGAVEPGEEIVKLLRRLVAECEKRLRTASREA
jgi:hypothetical protein